MAKEHRLRAMKYVNNGLKDLGLPPKERNDLSLKLQPIVEQRIAASETRTSGRMRNVTAKEKKAAAATTAATTAAKAQAKTTAANKTKANVEKAKKKILGGK